MKKFYSNSSFLIYFSKILNEKFPKEHFSDNEILIFQKDIISLCSSSYEDFWRDFNLKKNNNRDYKNICKKIEKYLFEKQPISYLNQKCFFNNFPLKVKKGVFIPQPDTEILVEKSLFLINQIWGLNNNIEILEIGTGSGNISISLAKSNSSWKITALDINKKALSVAEGNAESLDVNNIKFLFSDIFSEVIGSFDVIISNPPYISNKDYYHLSDYTKKQPKNALVAKNNGYWFYQEIISKSSLFLKEKFLVIFEIGYNQADEIIKILLSSFPDVKVDIFKDFGNNQRVIAFYR
ncbi:MAG: Release factor glutamine methyltransferase [Mycoplasmataceae bacterium]|nr:MAG: Release factor glutamine methyltransferase [Mycoplasmataceae bacterium]